MILRLRRMALGIALPLGAAAFLGNFGCGSDTTTQPATEPAPPTAVTASNGAATITLRWTASTDEGRNDFSYYSIYRSQQSMPLNTTPPGGNKIGQAAAGSGQYVDYAAADTTLYYYQVRSTAGSSISVASSEVQGIRRPEGVGFVIEEFDGPLASGFNFANADSVYLSAGNPDRFTLTDFYLGTTDSEDQTSAPLAIKSPDLLANRNAEWATYIAKMNDIGLDYTVSTAPEPDSSEATVVLNHVYVVKTPTARYAKIRIDAITTLHGYRLINFRYAYQTKQGLRLF